MAQSNANTDATTTTNTNPRDSKIMLGLDLPKNVGHLLKEPVEIDCPACRQHNLTRVDEDVITCMQNVAGFFNLLFCCCCMPAIKWEGRFDYNHYCSECGCYIGRYMTPGFYKRYMLLKQRNAVESGDSCCFVPDRKVKDEAKPKEPETMASNTPYTQTTVPIKK